jgi:hypothetical protein
MKYTITESQYGNIIDKFITHQFEPHKEKRTSESIFWVNDKIWRNINGMFSLKSSDKTIQVIKNWLEEHYGLGSLTPEWINFKDHNVLFPQINEDEIMLEEHYKLK